MTKYEFIEKYKDMFKNHWAYPEVGVGWLPLLDKLCALINHKIDGIINYNDKWLENEVITQEKYETNNKFLEDFKIIQIKEKFGGLRFYVSGSTPEINGWIRFAETMANELCEGCGTNQGLGSTSGWIRTICKPCAIKIEKGDVWMLKEDRKVLMQKELEEYNKNK